MSTLPIPRAIAAKFVQSSAFIQTKQLTSVDYIIHIFLLQISHSTSMSAK